MTKIFFFLMNLIKIQRPLGLIPLFKKDMERFIKAQEQWNTYNIALDEIRAGQKRTHWIWFIFPQLKGLGHSYNSEYYGIEDMEEARKYLSHPVLGKRLREITTELLKHHDKTAGIVMGSNIDALKLQSSMTLFDAISPNDIFAECLQIFFGERKDQSTLEKLTHI